jgi:hypothetical protein
MRKPGTTLLSSALMLAVIGALVTWVGTSSHADRSSEAPYGSVVFLGYTNGNSGSQLATFAITNASDVAVARAPHCLIWFERAGGGWSSQWIVPLSGSSQRRVLGAGMSEIVTLPPPPNLSPWRISIWLSNDVGPTYPIKRLVNAAWALVGKPEQYGWATRQIDSGRIDNRR